MTAVVYTLYIRYVSTVYKKNNQTEKFTFRKITFRKYHNYRRDREILIHLRCNVYFIFSRFDIILSPKTFMNRVKRQLK